MGASTIPLAALSQQPQEDLLGRYGKLMQLKALQTRAQMAPLELQQKQQEVQQGQQSLQSGQMQLEQQQRDMQDQQTVQKVLAAHQGDLESALPDLASSVSAKTYIGLQKAHLDIKKTTAEIDDKELKVRQDQNSRLVGLISQAQALPPDQYAQQWPQIAQSALEINPKLAGHVNPQQPIPQQSLSGLGLGVMTQAQYEAKELAKRQAAAAAAELPGKVAESEQKQRVLAGTNSQGMTAAQQSEAQSRLAQQGLEKRRIALEGQRVGLEGQRVGIEQQKLTAGEIPLDQVTKTTMAGRNYISVEDLPKDKFASDVMKKQAAAAGVPVVNKDTAGILTDIDNAKTNQDYMLQVIGKKLASGAPERLWYGPKNTLEKMMQTDPDMGAIGTFRSAAIQSMRAVAGSKGLRINRSEIQMAIDNDIPSLTDTLPVAEAKLKNMKQFLENAEASHLVRNRQAEAPQQVQGGTSASPAANNFFSQFGGKPR